ncbi:site-specific integrase [Zeimonas arvi]|uniref:Site-specific integrase n=1 Tax=Zeimonas arvi TaxID=2498847 RepID=A0A5C8NRF5_9BURK|nr:site-specific integrase [Zeimonas arvi]
MEYGVGAQIKITKQFIDEITANGERQVFRDSECKGLQLRVSPAGRKVWAYDYRDPAGKRQTFTVGDADRVSPGEARKKVRALGEDPAAEKRAEKVEAAKAGSRTLRAYLEGRYWDDHLKRARSGEATKKRILAAWAPLLDTDMAGLSVEKVAAHRLKRLDAGVKPQTLNRDRTALLALVNHAVDARLIDRNPLDDSRFKPFTARTAVRVSDDKRVRFLGQRDKDEDFRDEHGKKVGERERFTAALADSATPDYLRRLVTLALHTGMRRGEMFKLRWSEVSIERGDLRVLGDTAKTGEGRVIPLNAQALAVLRELREEKAPTQTLVFVNPDTDDAFTTLKRSWASLVNRAKVADFTLHDCRHDFASRLVQAGVPLEVVRDLLGHSSITLTERYAHLAPHQAVSAVAKLV